MYITRNILNKKAYEKSVLIILLTISSIITLIIFSGCASNRNCKTPTYNIIENEELIKIMTEYIREVENLPISKETEYMLLSIEKYGTTYYFEFRNAFKFDLSYINKDPIIICDAIENKKIIVRTNMFCGFIKGNIDETKNIYKVNYPSVHKKHNEIIETRARLIEEGDERMTEEYVLYHGRSLQIRFNENGKFIDSTYFFYNRTKL